MSLSLFLENSKVPELHHVLVSYLVVCGCLLAYLQPVLKGQLQLTSLFTIVTQALPHFLTSFSTAFLCIDLPVFPGSAQLFAEVSLPFGWEGSKNCFPLSPHFFSLIPLNRLKYL